MLCCLVVLLKYLSAALNCVVALLGSADNNSLTIYSACCFPFLGGIYFSILSLYKITPTLSPLFTAEKAMTAAISVAISFLVPLIVPNRELALTSTNNITVNSLSSSNTLLKG